MSSDEPGQREVAYRLFAAEYDDADYSYSESDEERAPNYVVTPTGARVNRLFVVGVLTEVEAVSDDVLRGRVADPTGAFVLYAGQYQPDEQAFLERTDPPAFVAVTGKARTFQPDDGDRVYTSIRPESINTVDAETRDRWTVQAAEQTLDRVGHAATALATGLAGEGLRETLEDRGVDPAVADGITRALAHYGTTPAYLDAVRQLALDAARVVAGQRDGVRELRAAPDDPGDVTAEELVTATPETDVATSLAADREPESDTATASAAETSTGVDATPSETESEAAPGESTADTRGTEVEPDTEPADTASADTTPDTEPTDTASADTTPDTEPTDTASADTTPDATAGADTTVDANATDDTETAAAGGDPGDFEPGEFDLSEEVREEVQEEYGTDFQSGTEVDEPGEADIPTPEAETGPESEPEPTDTMEAEPETDEAADTDGEAGVETTTDAGDEDRVGEETAKADTDDEETPAESEDIDPQEAVLAVMDDLDDGSGADREAVIREASERHGLSDEEVEDAIQGALMDGQCYEPDESSLKPI